MRSMRLITATMLVFCVQIAIAHPFSAELAIAPNLGNGHFSEPKGIHGARAALRYLPKNWDMNDIQWFVEGNVTHYRSRDALANHTDSITLLGLAPIVRLSFPNHTQLTPYIEFSIGGAWLSQSEFNHRKLGGQLQFQDMAGMGVRFGKNGRFLAAAHIIHYSNAGFMKDNQGITAPLLLSLGWNFM